MSALEITTRENTGARKLSVVSAPEFEVARPRLVKEAPQITAPHGIPQRRIVSPREIVRPDRPDSRKQSHLRSVPHNSVSKIVPVSREWQIVTPPAAKRTRVAQPAVQALATPQSALHRVLVVLLLLATMFAVFSVAMAIIVGLGSGLPVDTVIQVQPGDTLWSIAAAVSGDGSVSETAKAIADMNSLANGQVFAGQELLIPAN
ncbi:MAG: LysM peptidoglycan-binding domain-containing protein [Trueperella sp.]|nr:LysM peptidoglycan-binding domain-containing protein [Trueperella sp.]